MPPHEPASLTAGLFLVATPIGAARDITLRALDILRAADVIAAEDTRNTRKLMEIHGVALAGRPIIPYHDHNGAAQRPRILRMIAEGKSVAYVSDAGTPLVADPGFRARAGRHSRRAARARGARSLRGSGGARRGGVAKRPVSVRGLPATGEIGARNMVARIGGCSCDACFFRIATAAFIQP